MKKLPVFFKSGDLTLEGLIEMPGEKLPGPGVVFCHPHPLYGGSMDNNVLNAVSTALTEKGIFVLRFNFRGVGKSEGSFDGGRGETEDALAAVSFLAGREEIGSSEIGLMGYSFGGAISLAAGEKSSRVAAIAAVAPIDIPGSGNDSKPRPIICGSKDSLVPPAGILQKKEEMPGLGEVEVVDGADHFWWGFEENAAALIADFFRAKLD